MAVTLNLTLNVCKGTHWEDMNVTYPNTTTYNTTTTPPDWFEDVQVMTEWQGAFKIDPDETGTFTIGISNILGDTGTITINVLDCAEGFTFCPANAIANVAWLNPAGGWSTYIFAGMLTKGVDVGKASTFKDRNRVKKYAERKDAYITRVVTTGYIPKPQVDFLRTLRYAIQAFLYNDNTSAWDIPIMLESENFDEYDNKQQLFEVRIKFSYATELFIQSQ